MRLSYREMRPQLLLRRLSCLRKGTAARRGLWVWCARPDGRPAAGCAAATVWPVTQLTAGDPRFRDDRGGADPAVRAAIDGYAAGTVAEDEMLAALAGSRLLVPVVAVLGGDGEIAPGQGEKDSEMAMPSIVGRDGRRALPAFTSLETLQLWQPAARPVPVPALSVWQAAAEQSEAVIIDIGGPVPVAVQGARLAALAAGQPAPALHADPDVRAAVAATAARQPPGIRIRLGPPPAGADVALEIGPADPASAGPIPAAVTEAIVAEVAASLGSRSRRGIALVVPSAGTTRGR
jgi:SseB protein N-terminal domain